MRLYVFSALSDFEKNCRITGYDDNAGHQKSENHEKFLGWCVISPGTENWNVYLFTVWFLNIRLNSYWILSKKKYIKSKFKLTGYDDNAGHQKSENHEKFLGWCVISPGTENWNVQLREY